MADSRLDMQVQQYDAAPDGAILSDKMVGELRAVWDELGGEAVLGRVRSERDLQSAIREGFPQQAVGEIMHGAGLSLQELARALDLSPRSLQRRRRQGRLDSHESDRLYRLARIIALAKRTFGGDDAGVRWLKRPNRALGGQVPLTLIDTEPGARAVENVLGRIAYGGIS